MYRGIFTYLSPITFPKRFEVESAIECNKEYKMTRFLIADLNSLLNFINYRFCFKTYWKGHREVATFWINHLKKCSCTYLFKLLFNDRCTQFYLKLFIDDNFNKVHLPPKIKSGSRHKMIKFRVLCVDIDFQSRYVSHNITVLATRWICENMLSCVL